MNNKLPQISFIFDRRKVASSTRKSAVEIRITHNYKQKYISSGVMLYANQWKNGNIINCSDTIQISRTLDKMVSNIRQVIFDMLSEGNIDIQSISDRLDRMKQERLGFIAFCKQRADIRKYGKSKDSQERYNRFIRLFEEYGKIKYL